MRVEKTVCDRKSCKTGLDARPFKIFKERKADNAGDMENDYYAFDLCPKCTGDILNWVLAHEGSTIAEELIRSFQIEVRVE